MRELVEVVHFHAQTTDTSKLVAPPYQPKPEEYVPENFAPMQLAQLLVIPKNAPNSFGSLREMRAAKEKELAASGIGYKIEPPEYSNQDWPQDSFWVSISTPYRLSQQYTQSDKNFFIFTAGINLLDPAESYVRDILNSLQKYLEPFRRQVSEDFLIYKNLFVMVPWFLISVIFGVLGLSPNRNGWPGRLRLIGRTTLIFSTVLLLAGCFALYLGWRYGLDRWVNRGSIDLWLVLIMPWMCRALSGWLGGRRLWRVYLWMAGINLLPAMVVFVGALDYAHGRIVIDGQREFFAISWDMMALGLICGICFGLTHVGNEGKAASNGAAL